jgi:hypothetical protein
MIGTKVARLIIVGKNNPLPGGSQECISNELRSDLRVGVGSLSRHTTQRIPLE